MIPLTTIQGLDANTLADMARDRPVMIWGTGDLAQDVAVALKKCGLPPAAFLHTRVSPDMWFHGLPVHDAQALLDRFAGHAVKPFLVLAAPAFLRQAQDACRQAGLQKSVDFVTYAMIRRPHAVIEIADTRMRPLPFHAMDATDARFMALDDFLRVIDKLNRDLPHLVRIGLSCFGDPLLHRDLPAMIAAAQRIAPVTLTTGLAGDLPLAPVMDAAPDRIDIAVTGRPSPAMQARLETILSHASACQGRTRVLLQFYPTRQDDGAAMHAWRAILAQSAARFLSCDPYVMPYNHLMDNAPSAAQAHLDALPWNLTEMKALSIKDKDLPCLSQRVFPIIHTDLSVGLCHLYNGRQVAENYLSTDWARILQNRHQHNHCMSCQAQGLHRLDIEVLKRRHGVKE